MKIPNLSILTKVGTIVSIAQSIASISASLKVIVTNLSDGEISDDDLRQVRDLVAQLQALSKVLVELF